MMACFFFFSCLPVNDDRIQYRLFRLVRTENRWKQEEEVLQWDIIKVQNITAQTEAGSLYTATVFPSAPCDDAVPNFLTPHSKNIHAQNPALNWFDYMHISIELFYMSTFIEIWTNGIYLIGIHSLYS